MSHRAPFIVIEGLDRSGKTTQTHKLHEALKDIGVEAKLIKFPGKHLVLSSRDQINPLWHESSHSHGDFSGRGRATKFESYR